MEAFVIFRCVSNYFVESIFGIANEYKQYHRCAKVKRLLGGSSSEEDANVSKVVSEDCEQQFTPSPHQDR